MSTAENPEDDLDNEIPSSPTELVESVEVLIEMRIHKLNNRRYLLQQMRQVTRKKDRDHNLEQMSGEDDDEDVSELEVVERELEELLHQKNNLHNENPNATVNTAGPVCISQCKIETPEGGVYMLPPLVIKQDIVPLPSIHDSPDDEPIEETLMPDVPEQEQENQNQENHIQENQNQENQNQENQNQENQNQEIQNQEIQNQENQEQEQEQEHEQEQEQEDIKEIQPVLSLGRDGGFTQCPSCEELVFTQTKKFNGDSVWLLCCLCSMFGGFGLCFIPFCMDKLKSVRHKCPQCQTVIHTFNPF